MVPLNAEILTEQLIGDERASVRRTLRLSISTHSSGIVVRALILNISETGLLLETAAELAVGEMLQVDIPEAPSSVIRVVWTHNRLAGCEFLHPVSIRAVSAARLKSPSVVQDPNWDESANQNAIYFVISIVSALALLILLAAILRL